MDEKLKQILRESTGTHVGRAMEVWDPPEDVESDEKETEEIAKKAGGDVEKMQKVSVEEYLTKHYKEISK